MGQFLVNVPNMREKTNDIPMLGMALDSIIFYWQDTIASCVGKHCNGQVALVGDH